MNTLESLNLPEELGYTARHLWVRKDGDAVVIGITDFAQGQLGEILFVDLPDAGASFGSDDEIRDGGIPENRQPAVYARSRGGHRTQRRAGSRTGAREPQLLRRGLDAPHPAFGNAHPAERGRVPKPTGRVA